MDTKTKKADLLRLLYPKGIPPDAYDRLDLEADVAQRLLSTLGVLNPDPAALAAEFPAGGVIMPPTPRPPPAVQLTDEQAYAQAVVAVAKGPPPDDQAYAGRPSWAKDPEHVRVVNRATGQEVADAKEERPKIQWVRVTPNQIRQDLLAALAGPSSGRRWMSRTLRDHLGRSWYTVEPVLQQLIAEGLVETHQGRRKKHQKGGVVPVLYRLTDAGRRAAQEDARSVDQIILDDTRQRLALATDRAWVDQAPIVQTPVMKALAQQADADFLQLDPAPADSDRGAVVRKRREDLAQLLRSGPATVFDLAQTLGCHISLVYDGIAALRKAGAAVHRTQQGPARGPGGVIRYHHGPDGDAPCGWCNDASLTRGPDHPVDVLPAQDQDQDEVANG